MPDFPQLPIIQLPTSTPPPRKTQVEKYGGLFFAGIGGLVILVALLVYFGIGVWSMRDVWTRIYIVNDPKRPDSERIPAAYELSRDPRVTPRQRWDLALSRVPPELARYLLAESLTSEAMADDPRAYVLSVSRSEGWPDWLRLMLARPLAYGAGEGKAIPAERLIELRRSKDPILALWADYTLALGGYESGEIRSKFLTLSQETGPYQKLAKLLLMSLDAPQPARSDFLDQATRWTRDHHPDVQRVWKGWCVEGTSIYGPSD